MGKQTGTILISGITIGNVIFYKRGDQYLMRSKPGAVKQTRATKRSATVFGKASSAARLFYSAFRELIPAEDYRLPLFNACRATMIEVMSAQTNGRPAYGLLCNYRLVDRFSAPKFMKQPGFFGMADGIPILKIPAFEPKNILAPPRTQILRFKFTALAIDILKINSNTSEVVVLDYEYNNTPTAEQEIKLPLHIEEGQVVFVGAQVCYLGMVKGKVQEINKKGYDWTGMVGMFDGK